MISADDFEIWEMYKVVHNYFYELENREIARKKERERERLV